MTAGGVLTASIGIGHIFMPDYGYDGYIAHGMPQLVRDHFYYLGTYAICLFLLSFAGLSLYFSRFSYPKATAIVATVFSMFWVLRALLEVRFPVSLRIFFLQNPHTVLLPVMIFLTLVYAASALKSWYLVRTDAA